MKKTIKFIRNNILGILVRLSLCLNGVIIAENMLSSEQVSYSNDKTSETTVNGNLDELFAAVDINERLGSADISAIGDGIITGSIKEKNTNKSNKLIISSISIDNIFIGKDEYYIVGSLSVKKDGYKPIGIVGYHFEKATTDGTGFTYATLSRNIVLVQVLFLDILFLTLNIITLI